MAVGFAYAYEDVRRTGTVLVLPVCNPAAFAAGTRTHPADGMNLARCFPGDAGGSPTQRLAASLMETAAGGASYLIDLHSGGVEYDFLPLAGFYGKPSAGNSSYCAARVFGLSTLWNLPDTPGVLSYELHRRGATVVGCEYRGGGRLDLAGRHDYLRGIRFCLSSWNVISTQESAGPRTDPACHEGDWVLAESSGIFIAERGLGDVVQEGDLVAKIVGPGNEERQRLLAPWAGVILALRSKAYIQPGNWGVLVGRPQQLGYADVATPGAAPPPIAVVTEKTAKRSQ